MRDLVFTTPPTDKAMEICPLDFTPLRETLEVHVRETSLEVKLSVLNYMCGRPASKLSFRC